MAMNEEQFAELGYYIKKKKRSDGALVTDKWIDQQLVDCLAEIRALGQQLEDLEAITFNTAGLESAAKRIVRSWKKEEKSEADLAPLIENLRDALKACNPGTTSKPKSE